MKRFKGTKGKWIANELKVYDEKGFEVVEMPYPFRIKEDWDKIAPHWGMPKNKGITYVDVSDEETIANAQLIATAPEMLELLIEFQNATDQFDLDEAIAKVDNVINKALGL